MDSAETAATHTGRPIHKIRVGSVSADIWANPTEKGKFYSVTFQKSYKTDDGEWHNSTSFGTGDLLELGKVADLAHTHILGLNQERAAAR